MEFFQVVIDHLDANGLPTNEESEGFFQTEEEARKWCEHLAPTVQPREIRRILSCEFGTMRLRCIVTSYEHGWHQYADDDDGFPIGLTPEKIVGVVPAAAVCKRCNGTGLCEEDAGYCTDCSHG